VVVNVSDMLAATEAQRLSIEDAVSSLWRDPGTSEASTDTETSDFEEAAQEQGSDIGNLTGEVLDRLIELGSRPTPTPRREVPPEATEEDLADQDDNLDAGSGVGHPAKTKQDPGDIFRALVVEGRGSDRAPRSIQEAVRRKTIGKPRVFDIP
jgi:hypothetical protein